MKVNNFACDGHWMRVGFRGVLDGARMKKKAPWSRVLEKLYFPNVSTTNVFQEPVAVERDVGAGDRVQPEVLEHRH
jgi:hypothetical protein